MQKKEIITIIGAGLCGSMLACFLAKRGYQVEVYERRPDLRKTDISAGRSINLALSDRGLSALDKIGLSDKAKQLAIPMEGRMIHGLGQVPYHMPYSGRQGEYINSISRGGLNALLMDEAENTGNVRIHFNTTCQYIDFTTKTITFFDTIRGVPFQVQYDINFGTDGAGSEVRGSIMAKSPQYLFDFSQEYLATGYKELEIPPGPHGAFQLSKNALHIWPRDGFMMIALPNVDGSFTVTLFLPWKGKYSFEQLTSDVKIQEFFNQHFDEVTQYMPDLITDFHANPSSALGTIKCFPWVINHNTVLMGDAAHAIVPFYGQGMNASFEDCLVLDALIHTYDHDWAKILQHYQSSRKPDTDAIADLARDNFYEMRDATADPIFVKKRAIELHLEQNYPQYFSKYSLVTFRKDIPYHEAMVRGRRQDQLLMSIAKDWDGKKPLNYNDIYASVSSLSSS